MTTELMNTFVEKWKKHMTSDTTQGQSTAKALCFPWDKIPDGMTYYDIFRTKSYDPEVITMIDIAQYAKSKMKATGVSLFIINIPYILH